MSEQPAGSFATVVEATAPVLAPELSPHTARSGEIVSAGFHGVSHGSGLLGELIRHATESWAGHAFIYIGDGQIVEGTAPVARVAAADSHPDAVWNSREQLTVDRTKIVARAQRSSARLRLPGLHRLRPRGYSGCGSASNSTRWRLG